MTSPVCLVLVTCPIDRAQALADMLVEGRHASMRTPALIIAGWHDLLLANDLRHFTTMKREAATPEAQRATRIVIGPWSHGMFMPTVGDLDFGLRASGLGWA